MVLSYYSTNIAIFCVVYICLSSSTVPGVGADDLYSVLNVQKFASQKEIKQAYKQLAREWHPDKNKSPEAADKFTKINEAYETLGDVDKRSRYDKFGETSANERQQGQDHAFQQFFRSSFGNGFTFNFGGGGRDSVFDKNIVTMRSYENKIEGDTYLRPYVFYVYGDFCIACLQIDHLIEHLFKDLESVGIGMGAIHAGMDGGLRKYLYTHHYPAIVGVRNGRPVHFKGDVNMAALRKFARSLFPEDTLVKLTDANMNDYLNGWQSDNKVRVVLFNNRDVPPASYLVLAYMHRATMSFAIVMTKSTTTRQIVAKNRVDVDRETLMIFNEEPSPVVTMSMKQIPRATMTDTINAHQYLTLPRLSNNHFFDNLCPESTLSNRKKLCVVLITAKSLDHARHVATFRQFARENTADRVKFLYIYADVQKKLVQALTKADNDSVTSHVLQVVIIWRMEARRLGYEWLDGGWTIDNDEQSEEQLAERLAKLLQSKGHLRLKATLPDLYNEHALALPTRIINRLNDWSVRLYDYITGHDSITVTMVLFAALVIAAGAIVMHKMVALEEESVQNAKRHGSSNQPRCQLYNSRPANRSADEKLLLYELTTKSYDTLVKNSDTGLTITLLVDESSQDKLIEKFRDVMYPHSRYSGLTFAYLHLDRHLAWYRQLLQKSLDNKEVGAIRVHNCVGTVLGVNGFRRYYYLYHPKRGPRFMRSARSKEAGRAMGLYGTDDSSDGGDDDDTPLFEGGVLDGLGNWMERIFDGSIQKIRIDSWHDM